MNNLLIRISNNHDRIFKALLILAAILGIAYLMPHKVRYKFDFKKGKAWNYEDLVAPVDFAVLKHPDSLRMERDRAIANVLPYYTIDTAVATRLSNELKGRLNGKTKLTLSQSKAIDLAVNSVYSQGVVTNIPENFRSIAVVEGSRSSTQGIQSFYNGSDGSEKLRKNLSQSFTEEQLSALSIPESIPANLNYDDRLNTKVRNEVLDGILPTSGMVRRGEVVITRGQPISEEKYLILQSLKLAADFKEPDPATARWLFGSQMVLVAVALSMLVLFLAILRKDIFADNRKVSLILILILIHVAIYTGIMKAESLSPYLAPMCILPIIVRVFFDTRLALFTHVITVLMLGFVAPGGYEFVFMQTIAGMVTIFSVTNLRRRAQLFISVGLVLLAYLVCYASLTVLYDGSIQSIQLIDIYWIIGNVLLTLFSYPLIYIFERLFGITSDVSLMELSDSNSPLLRELSMKAPGTFQHSMQVANLAEAATFSIGGNALLVRTGALYHDIGKMESPMYFIENQNSNINPHDDLSFEESAAIITGHVLSGIEIARKNKLPDLVIDFIRTHHGTSMVQYFYQSYLKNFPEVIVDEEAFRYPGPIPFSKETAVLMMADSVEAASRSLPIHSSEAIHDLVDKIIDGQIESEQFVNCDITFKDITVIKKIFKKMLMSIYHVRVEYPTARPAKI